MQWEKKICIRITTRRIAGAILIATSSMNLMIVGAVIEAASTDTSTPTSSLIAQIRTPAFFFPTTTQWATASFTPMRTDVISQTPVTTSTHTIIPPDTPSAALTHTFVPTETQISSPTLAPSCMPWRFWPRYFVQQGDTLTSLAYATGSTDQEIMLANCLSNAYIYPGQLLYLPSMPYNTFTPTPSITPTFKPSTTLTVTPSITPTDIPTATPAATMPGSGLACLEFEDLKPGSTYKVGESFVSSGASIIVEPFVWGNGTPTGGGIASVSAQQLAGGFGMELQVNNINITLFPGGLPDSLSLLFGEYGGNLNINVNGDFRNFENFADVDGLVIGGGKVSVLKGSGNDAGFLQITGTIKSFVVGGQELWIDNVCISP
jgi:LysM repeat protein